MFELDYSPEIRSDLRGLRAYERMAVLDRIDEQLTRQPTVETAHRKRLAGLVPPWDHVPPVWELRVGDWRAFYDVDEIEHLVHVRALRRKPPHATTEEIL